MKIYICTDSRGFLAENAVPWTTQVKQRAVGHDVELATWDYTIYTFGRLLTSLKSRPRPDLVVTQLGHAEMCLGPEPHKMGWVREIPAAYNVQLRHLADMTGFDPCIVKTLTDRQYDTLVDCQAWMKDVLREIDTYNHLAVLPTRTSKGSPDFDRLNELRAMLMAGRHPLELPLDTEPDVTFDGEHYTARMHALIADKVLEFIS